MYPTTTAPSHCFHGPSRDPYLDQAEQTRQQFDTVIDLGAPNCQDGVHTPKAAREAERVQILRYDSELLDGTDIKIDHVH
jgi:hypothetical protein